MDTGLAAEPLKGALALEGPASSLMVEVLRCAALNVVNRLFFMSYSTNSSDGFEKCNVF